jgi:hypothetical protein
MSSVGVRRLEGGEGQKREGRKLIWVGETSREYSRLRKVLP